MDANQDDSIGSTSPIATNTNGSSSSPMASQTSPIADGIVFDSDIRSNIVDQVDNNSVPAISDEMKLDGQSSPLAQETHPGIENGSSRFSSSLPDKETLPVDTLPSLPEVTPPEPKVATVEVHEEDEPKGEILTSFVNNQNYSDVKNPLAQSLPTETTKNETNSSLHDSISVPSLNVVTPDPTKVNEAESHLNPASFAMPASTEIRSALPEETAPISAVAAEQSHVESTSAVKNHVPLSEHYDHIASSSESAPATIVPEKKKASLKWLWITLGSIFGVVFVFAGLVTATETGVVNWGLDKYYSKMGVQKIWKGLPFDSRGALLISAIQMTKVSQSHIVADMTVNVSVGADSPAYSYLHEKGGKFAADFPADPTVATGGDIEMTTDDSTAIADTMPTVPIFDKFSVNLKFDSHANSTKSDTSFTIQSDMLPTYMSMVELTPEEGNKITSEQKFTGDAWYSHMPLMNQVLGVDVTKWIKTENTDLESLGLSTAEESASDDLAKEIEDYSKVIKSGTRTGVETIDGVKANKYQFEINMIAVAMLSGEEESDVDDNYKNTSISADVWIGQKDKFIRKIVLNLNGDMDGTAISLVANVTVSDINKDFEVVAPADDQVETKTMQELLEGVTSSFYGDDTNDSSNSLSESRDMRRTADVDSILSAVHASIIDNKGALPAGLKNDMSAQLQIGTASGPAINNAACVIAENAHVDLTKPLALYLNTIPVDPVGGTFSSTAYAIQVNENNIVTVTACNSENGVVSSSR